MTNYTDLIARLQKMVDGRYATTEEIQTLAALEAAQAEIDRLTAELGDLPEAQADMLRTIKELQASLAWITEYIRAAPPELEEAKKWLLVMDNAAAGASPVEPSESVEHRDGLAKRKPEPAAETVGGLAEAVKAARGGDAPPAPMRGFA